MEPGRTRLIKAMGQAAAIIAAACILAVCVNLLREDGIAFVGDWSADARFADDSGHSLVIGLKEASRLYAENQAVFVDARPKNQYHQGHIKGAVSLPWQEINERFMEVADLLEEAETLICYCDGESCELSHELALFLADMGFEDARVFINGWRKWRQAGLPTQTGDQSNE